jgi:DNA-binding NarL/FixJ family response regulator
MLETTVNPMASDSAKRHWQIVLVEDHAVVREGLTKIIEQEGDLQICGQAAEAGEAYRIIAAKEPDLAIVDLALQSGSGLDLIKQLQTLPRPPRVLVLSMHDEEFYAERALRAGALGYVMKRESPGKVVEAIRQILTGRYYFSASLGSVIAKKFSSERGAPIASSFDRLGDRELHVFRLIGQGWENRQIAVELGVSLKTVQAHCEHIKTKLGISNATALIREAVRWAESEGKNPSAPPLESSRPPKPRAKSEDGRSPSP